ncbi:MAG: (2Fe-2S)-binding protein [Lysobacterales bacterium]
MAQRISSNIERGNPITVTVNGAEVSAYRGETIATVLLAQDITTFNVTHSGEPRGPFCNMGTCFECQVKVADAGSRTLRWQRSCMVPVEAGMTIVSGASLHTSGTEPIEN